MFSSQFGNAPRFESGLTLILGNDVINVEKDLPDLLLRQKVQPIFGIFWPPDAANERVFFALFGRGRFMFMQNSSKTERRMEIVALPTHSKSCHGEKFPRNPPKITPIISSVWRSSKFVWKTELLFH